MVEHPVVKVTVVRFVEKEGSESKGVALRLSRGTCNEKNYSFSTAEMDREKEKEFDEATAAKFRSKWEGTAEYTEKVANNIVDEVLPLGQSGDYDLIVVGKGRFPSRMVAELADQQAKHAELGPIGDILASSRNCVVSSVLVVQQHDVAHMEEVPEKELAHTDEKLEVVGSSRDGEISKENEIV